MPAPLTNDRSRRRHHHHLLLGHARRSSPSTSSFAAPPLTLTQWVIFGDAYLPHLRPPLSTPPPPPPPLLANRRQRRRRSSSFRRTQNSRGLSFGRCLLRQPHTGPVLAFSFFTSPSPHSRVRSRRACSVPSCRCSFEALWPICCDAFASLCRSPLTCSVVDSQCFVSAAHRFAHVLCFSG